MAYLQKPQLTQLKLRVSCQELNRIFYKDTLDALLVVKTQKDGLQPEIVFTSQVVKESFDPSFPEEITLHHSFQNNQRYLFQIFHNSTQKNPIGQVKLAIKELLTAPESKVVRQLRSGFKMGGKMSIMVKEVQRNCEFIYLKLRGEKLQHKPWWSCFRSHQLYFRVSRVWQNHSQSLYVSQCHPHGQIIQWRQFYLQYNHKYQIEQQSRVKLQLCCLTAQSQQILAEKVLEWKELPKIENFQVFDREAHVAGHFVVMKHRVAIEHSFDEFVRAGMEINLTIGIDFSASIKKHTHPDSPHYTGKGSSQYLDALIALSSFVLDYSHKKQASVYSVGAKVKHPKVYTGEKVQDCFPINGDFQNPQLQGLEGIAQVYHSILDHLQFSGPTNFRKVIEKAMGECLQNKQKREGFSVLIILSDGKLANTKELKQVLQGCATLPIYVILLAIGNECSELQQLSSTKMEVFTGDKCLVERENMINVGSYLGKKQKLHEISRKLFQNLPHVVSRYMSLRKKTPQNIEKSTLKKTSESRKSQTHGFNPEL